MRLSRLFIFAATAVATISCARTAPISHPDWAPDVKEALNDFIKEYGSPKQPEYAVFDFDNTSAIFDVSMQLMAHQLETMSFSQTPEEFSDNISICLSGCWDSVYGKIEEIISEYGDLYDKYGPFTHKGVDSTTCAVMRADPQWSCFAEDMGLMYKYLDKDDNVENAFIWVMGWLSGMTSDESYDLSYRSHKIYSEMETRQRNIGAYEWTEGIQVTDNIRELWKALHENGIDVWVCSASSVEAVIAAVDAFGLHDFCTGVVAMTFAKDSLGRLTGRYDYTDGHAMLSQPDGSWSNTEEATGVETWGTGKVESIDRCIAPHYDGRGPIAGFMDSTGDFNFCTEYSSLKLCVCFNRASRKVTDGGGLISETALYERDALGYDLRKANAAGDIFYVLQGRDENGLRSLRPSNATLRLGADKEKVLADEQNEAQLDYFKKTKPSVREILEKYSIETEADDPSNPLGFKYGFLKSYNGYMSR